MVGLRRAADWTWREAEVRLADQAARRTALGVRHVPDSTTGYRLLRRLAAAALAHPVRAGVPRRVSPPGHQATGAVAAPGRAPGARSTVCVTRAHERGDGVTWRHWLQWPRAVAVARPLRVAQTARRGPTEAWATRRPLGEAAHQRRPLALGRADAEVDRERQHPPSRQSLHAHRVMPATRGGPAWRRQGGRAQRREAWPAHRDRRRALLASRIAAVTRQRSARAPGRALQTQRPQA
jgi:hypothetical protein